MTRRRARRLDAEAAALAPPRVDVDRARERALSRARAVLHGESPEPLSAFDSAVLRADARARHGIDLSDPEHVAALRARLVERLAALKGK